MYYSAKMKLSFSYICHAQTKLDVKKYKRVMTGRSKCNFEGLKETLIVKQRIEEKEV
jgi:hypothetical protein